MHVRPSHVRQVGARESGAEVDARKYGAELGARIYGAKIHGVELMPCPRHASSHVNDTQKMTLDLGAKAISAETCKLGANCHSAEVRVYFLKGYCQGCICKNLSKKGLKNKKFGVGEL